jgi:hypothetical protein
VFTSSAWDVKKFDLIVCYDAQKYMIVQLQSLCSSGQRPDTCVVVLLAENRKVLDFEGAKELFKFLVEPVYANIVFKYHEDPDPLLPRDVRPVCVREGLATDKSVGVKRKRLEDRNQHSGKRVQRSG